MRKPWPVVVAYHRTEQGFVREVYSCRETILPLPEIQIELPLSEVYDRVEFPLNADAVT